MNKFSKITGLIAAILSPIADWLSGDNTTTTAVKPPVTQTTKKQQEKMVKFRVMEVNKTTTHFSGAKTSRDFDTIIPAKEEQKFRNESKKAGDSIIKY